MGSSKSVKADGVSNIPTELPKACGLTVLQELATVFRQVFKTRVIYVDWRRSIIVPIFKGKVCRRQCGKYRGVSLLLKPGKVFARVLLERKRPHLLVLDMPEQSGLTVDFFGVKVTPKKSTFDSILTLRVLIGHRREFRRPFYEAYIDFRKAFDSVHRGTLLEIVPWDLSKDPC